jgi:chromosome partitioning protein
LTKVISLANQKGGVGKTTCTINLGGALAELGYRVLCIDMDPQANLTVGLGISLGDVHRSMADVLNEDRVGLDEVIRETAVAGLSVAPATLELASTEVELFTAIGREMVLGDAISGSADRQYDVILIDSPPTLGLLTINALVASSRIIIPVQTQFYAIKGLTALIKVINTIRVKLNHDLEILGLLPTFYDGRTILAREMLENLRELGDQRVFNTMIKNTVKLGEAPLTGRPVTEYAPSSAAAHAFRDLAREVIELG